MAVENCTYPIIGRFKAVALILADECGTAIGGADSGWVDHCPAALSMDDDIDEGEDFTRRCADGSVMVDLPGRQTLIGIDFDLDLHGVDPEFAALASGSSPVTQGADIVGWDDCADGSGSLQVYLWREIVGADACDPETGEPRYLLTILPWADQVRVVNEGTFGGDDGFVRISGRSRTGHAFGIGGLPIFADDLGEPECPDDPIASQCTRRTVITTLAPPTDCGLITVTPCEEGE